MNRDSSNHRLDPAIARPIERRLESLEIQLAHTQRMCEQLNEVVTQMSLAMRKRDRMLDALTQQIKDLKQKSDGGSSMENERPPHY